MKKISPLVWGLFAGGFVLGILVFFPLDSLRSSALNRIRQQTGIDVNPRTLYLSSGLTLGFKRASLFALKAEDVTITMTDGNTLKCRELLIAPKILPLLITRLSVSIRCLSPQSGNVTAQMTGSPFWSPQTLTVGLDMDQLSLSLANKFLPSITLNGRLSGEALLIDYVPGARKLPKATWNISGEGIQSPAVNSDFFSLPQMDLGPLKSTGTYENNRLEVQELSFGTPQSNLEGRLTANLSVDARGMLSSGDLSGRLRTESNFEKLQLKDINMDLSFGPVKASGYREFRKKMEGGPQSLLFNPPLDK